MRAELGQTRKSCAPAEPATRNIANDRRARCAVTEEISLRKAILVASLPYVRVRHTSCWFYVISQYQQRSIIMTDKTGVRWLQLPYNFSARHAGLESGMCRGCQQCIADDDIRNDEPMTKELQKALVQTEQRLREGR